MFSFSSADLSSQQPRRNREKLFKDSIFRERLRKVADSLQRVQANPGDTIKPTVREISIGTAEQVPIKKDTAWLLPVAGIAVLGAAYFLYKRRKS